LRFSLFFSRQGWNSFFFDSSNIKFSLPPQHHVFPGEPGGQEGRPCFLPSFCRTLSIFFSHRQNGPPLDVSPCFALNIQGWNFSSSSFFLFLPQPTTPFPFLGRLPLVVFPPCAYRFWKRVTTEPRWWLLPGSHGGSFFFLR